MACIYGSSVSAPHLLVLKCGFKYGAPFPQVSFSCSQNLPKAEAFRILSGFLGSLHLKALYSATQQKGGRAILPSGYRAESRRSHHMSRIKLRRVQTKILSPIVAQYVFCAFLRPWAASTSRHAPNEWLSTCLTCFPTQAFATQAGAPPTPLEKESA